MSTDTAAAISNSAWEIQPSFRPRSRLTHVVFDFDGTLSLLRMAWQDTMLALFLELLPPPRAGTEAAVREELMTEILAFNGRQTIYQMRRFAERVAEAGANPLTPEAYLDEYSSRLRQGLDRRMELVRTGRVPPDEYLVHGARALLDLLRGRGCTLYLVSGTLEAYVREEAELLRLTEYFNGGIFGGHVDPERFSKERVFQEILAREEIGGESLLSFGDGPVEIRCTVDLGGLPVAVASDEASNGSGRMHAGKQAVLAAAGAELVIADYRDADELLALITGTR